MKKTMALIFMIALGGMLCGQSITVMSPIGGEHWVSKSHHNITWSFDGLPETNKVKLLLYHDGTLMGSIVENLAIGSNGTGTYDWTVGAYGGTTAPADGGYQVYIRRMLNAQPYGESPQAFSIAQPLHMQYAVKKVTTQTHEKYSHGILTIPKNLVCDLDEGKALSTPGCDDFWWIKNSIAPYQRLFIPCDGAHFKLLGIYADASWAVLHSVNFPSQQNPILDADLPVDMVVAYRTNPYMRWGSFRVVGKGTNDCLVIEWTTYK